MSIVNKKKLEVFSDNFIHRVQNELSILGICEETFGEAMDNCCDNEERLNMIETCLDNIGGFTVDPLLFIACVKNADLDELMEKILIAGRRRCLLHKLYHILYEINIAPWEFY